MAPGTAARAEHLKDGGLGGGEFIKVIDQGALPQVVFYKPQGNLNEHPGYTDVLDGDHHVADVITHLQNGPQWPHMVVIVTYDENGGFWDHVAPPKGPLGPWITHPGPDRLALRETGLCRSHALRHDIDPVADHQALCAADAAGAAAP
jgi:acid phosphatase